MKNTSTIILVCLSLMSITVHAKPDREKGLPPGLAKKAERGQPLPPGWQKKLQKGQTLDKAVYDHGRVVVPLDDKGYISIRVEDKVIRLLNATREIIDVTTH